MNESHAGLKSLTTLVIAPQMDADGIPSSESLGLDMQGYDRIKFTAAIGAMEASSELHMYVQESSEGTNMANATNIAGAAIVTVASTGNTNVVEIDVARPTKRYVGIATTNNSLNVNYSVTATRFRGSGDLPDTQPTGYQYVAVAAN